MMAYLLSVLAGMLLCNAIPHIAAGVRGEPFPSPFASPPGVGDSSPPVTFLWGAINLIAGGALAAFWVETRLHLAFAGFGFVLSGLLVARYFSRVRNGS
ncbi:hypothetical protein [Stakelama tenebrarum]|uniref:Uncharacterized protein n=1 Tax=Stakelama tenebrarum TaxID=2711215 RepID=A0A6G6Y2I4_9SPHN|nr:hypothetical protein [Sphingosinithalassobacter tenebrarum]QIG79110.1 hypothetical protein G5C33_04450 [Sphingosinithalassobacter tenebrarum]